ASQYRKNVGNDVLSFAGSLGRDSFSAASSLAHSTITSHSSIFRASAPAAATAPASTPSASICPAAFTEAWKLSKTLKAASCDIRWYNHARDPLPQIAGGENR